LTNIDGTTILISNKTYDCKKNANGDIQKFASNIDLWKTLSNWVDFINEDGKNSTFSQ
jgi:hypothetical protein